MELFSRGSDSRVLMMREWSYSKVPYTLEKSVVTVNAIVAMKTI